MFYTRFVLLTLTINLGVLCVDENEEIAEEIEIRKSREYNPEIWRAVEDEKIDMAGWIPQDSSLVSHENPVIRRRLRKRKKRPPHVSFEEQANSQERLNYFQRRRLRPFRLDQNQDVLEDMEEENNKRPANRRRIFPVYSSEEMEDREPELEIITEKSNNINSLQASIRFDETSEENLTLKVPEKIRDPFDALKEAEEKQRTAEQIKQTTIPPNLKALLKKSDGTISLSEILQQKNLSLAELLTGNAKAISALTSPPESTQSTESSPLSDITKYYRVLPSERKKISNRVFEQFGESTEAISSKEILEAQRKRLTLLHGRKENKVYLGLTRTYEIVTEPITEKRLFVPSHPKLYSTVSYKPSLLENSKRAPMMTSTTLKYSASERDEDERNNISESTNIFVHEDVPAELIPKKLPMTSAKLMTKTTKIPGDKSKLHQIPPKAMMIKLEDIFRNKISRESNGTVEDEPLKITLDLNTKKMFDTIGASSSEDEEMSSELEHGKLQVVTAREEILEMIKTSTYRDKLSKILKERNMTLQELMDQRERGSSQLHLADIFHNKTREPEPIEEHIGVMSSEYLENLREQKSRKFKTESSPREIPVILSKMNSWSTSTEIVQEGTTPPDIPPTQGQDFGTNNSFNYAAILPFWKQFHPDIFSQIYQNGNTNQLAEFHRIEEVHNAQSDNVDQLNVELKPKNYNLEEESFFDIPSGVKSALVASFAIAGLSLFMFLTILVIFRWTQRNKNKPNYTSSLSGVKIKSPILEMPHRSVLKTFVCETLGRQSNLYKSHLQSMSDVWDERKQKF